MGNSPDVQKLDEILRSSRIVAGGFMGDDLRDVSEVIEEDRRVVEGLGYSVQQVAERMQGITETATAALGTPVEIDGRLSVCVDEAKGVVVCPWPHQAGFDKRLTVVIEIDSDRQTTWSDLNIHMIAEHGFFEGHGSGMRIEPKKLIEIIFGKL